MLFIWDDTAVRTVLKWSSREIRNLHLEWDRRRDIGFSFFLSFFILPFFFNTNHDSRILPISFYFTFRLQRIRTSLGEKVIRLANAAVFFFRKSNKSLRKDRDALLMQTASPANYRSALDTREKKWYANGLVTGPSYLRTFVIFNQAPLVLGSRHLRIRRESNQRPFKICKKVYDVRTHTSMHTYIYTHIHIQWHLPTTGCRKNTKWISEKKKSKQNIYILSDRWINCG